jgi:dTDP-4-dehydrorhamnose 3,5-epimerase
MKPQVSKIGVYGDDRGLFFPLDISNKRWIQSNISISSKWTFRGLHHQKAEKAQSKFISVIKGQILDFLVDLRHGSFQDTYFFKLGPGEQIYVPKGFAHGFLALQDDTIIQYLVDNDYSPKDEISFDWRSNETVKELILAEVGNEENLLMSAKDSVGFEISDTAVETIDYSKI